MCFCCVRFSFFQYQAIILAWGNVSEMTHFVSSGTQDHNSVNHSGYRAAGIEMGMHSFLATLLAGSAVGRWRAGRRTLKLDV